MDDSAIHVPAIDLTLKLDRSAILESEKKIQSVVKILVKYLPGFDRIMPSAFLMAEETKWLSQGELIKEGRSICIAPVIHERVDFNLS